MLNELISNIIVFVGEKLAQNANIYYIFELLTNVTISRPKIAS